MRPTESNRPARLRGVLARRRLRIAPPIRWGMQLSLLLLWSCDASPALAQSSPQYLESRPSAQPSGQFVASGQEASAHAPDSSAAVPHTPTMRPALPPEAWMAPSHFTPTPAHSNSLDHSLPPLPGPTRVAPDASVVSAVATAPRDAEQSPVASGTARSRNKIRNPLAQAQAAAAPGSSATSGSSGTLQMLLSIGSSLLIVIGLFLGLAWFYRKTLSTPLGGLPKQVVQVLGRTQIATRQQLVLVRFGSKLVLVSLVQGEARTISEIADPLEVDLLAGLCESAQPGSISSSFRSILNQGGPTA